MTLLTCYSYCSESISCYSNWDDSFVFYFLQDEVDKITRVYDSFLSEFPLCYGYWKKYAEHKARLCSVEKAVQIYERAVQSVPYSVGLWVDYCSFGVSSFEDPLEICR